MLTLVSPNTWYEISPRGPSAKISAMAAVKGGEISGSSTTASSARPNQRGRLARTASSANAKPSAVPAIPTSAARSRLLTSAARCVQSPSRPRTASRLGPPFQKVSRSRRPSG